MNDYKYVAAIEVSSSKIMAAVGKMYPDGRLDIIATDQEKGVESVRYGILQNLEETSMRIHRVLDRLERKPSVAPLIITGLYVGLSGRSLRSISTEVEMLLPDDTEITQEIIDRLREKALATTVDSSLEVVDAIPRVYIVGKQETLSPKGAIGDKIRATFDLIVCRPEMRRNLQRTLVDKLDVNINGYIVTALSTAQVLLTSDEKRLGCMLVDMGAETTSVSIYKDGALRYFATLPLGGRNITRDITSLNVLEERAEEVKITSGNAMAREVSPSLNVGGIKMSEVSNLIVARAEEIVANIIEQLKYAGLQDSDLPAGLICIGGGVKLNGMIDLLAKKTDLPVRRATLPTFITLEDTKLPASDLLQVASIMYSGASNSDAVCLEEPQSGDEIPSTGEPNELPVNNDVEQPAAKPSKPGNGIFKTWADKIAGIFAGPAEDDSDLIE